MKILFLAIGEIKTINQSGIYTDLLRCFEKNGDDLFVITANESSSGERWNLIREGRASIVLVRTGNVQRTGLIRKGINTLLIQSRFKKAILHYFSEITFDLILYPTPPITFVGVVDFFKKRDNARTYLMLKDIFPQNAVDLGILCYDGLRGLLYKQFRKKEKKLYSISDCIGCMSEANVNYIVSHNPEINPAKVEVCPNCIEVHDYYLTEGSKIAIRRKYGIPQNKKVFVYGGNLGKPQGIPFIIECLKKTKHIENAFLLIVGDGTEYARINNFLNEDRPLNVKLIKRITTEDYDNLLTACDVGLIFLDHRFTIPNFPSRLLGYMQAGLPVIAATDTNTDIGMVIVENGFGWWCESNDSSRFAELVATVTKQTIDESMKEAELKFLANHYSAEEAWRRIVLFEKVK